MTVVGDPRQILGNVVIGSVPVEASSGVFHFNARFRNAQHAANCESVNLNFVLADKEGFAIEQAGEFNLFAHVDGVLSPRKKGKALPGVDGLHYKSIRIFTGIREDGDILRIVMAGMDVPEATRLLGLSFRLGEYETPQSVIPYTGKGKLGQKLDWSISPENRGFFGYPSNPEVQLLPVVRCLSEKKKALAEFLISLKTRGFNKIGRYDGSEEGSEALHKHEVYEYELFDASEEC
jgi:hypothetical protein